ncbi:MAG: hypothetical protein QG551_195 [Patescibacteria group bacterium]|jgi:hypothetical protein|nr:hypothetical protein [Patescibacteria group bacterium]
MKTTEINDGRTIERFRDWIDTPGGKLMISFLFFLAIAVIGMKGA